MEKVNEIIVEIIKAGTQKKEITGKSGKPFVLYQQEAWAHLVGAPYPVKITLNAPDFSGYATGKFVFSHESIVVNRFGQLSVGTVVLSPIK